MTDRMMEPLDVIALGELLIDFTENGWSNNHNPLLEANPGLSEKWERMPSGSI